MVGQQKLLILWACMLLMAALCPGVHSKRKGGFRGGKEKGDELGNKVQPSPSKSSSKQGLKLAGVAAAGAIGGAAIGYGLGSLGKTKQRYGHHGYGYDKGTSGAGQQLYHREGQGIHNLSNKRLFRNGAATGPTSNNFITLGPMVPFLIGAWIRGI